MYEYSELASVNQACYDTLGLAEDRYLMHLPYNIKEADNSGYAQFLCHCHEDWCFQLRVRDKYWGKQVKNEQTGTQVKVIQKAPYQVTPTGTCGECKACVSRKPYTRKNHLMRQRFTCPAKAISRSKKGIKIDSEKFLGCLQCVRNCYRIRQSDDIALTVERMPELKQNEPIPLNLTELEEARKESALEMNWTSFQYDIKIIFISCAFMEAPLPHSLSLLHLFSQPVNY